MTQKNSVDAKTVLLGATMVGKTSIICRAVSNEFDPEMPATIGACYTAKQVELNNATVNLQIWDTAGQERFRTLAPMYYRCSVIALLVFSVTEATSLSDVRNWAEEIRAQTDEMPALFVVANKVDLENERVITTADGQKMADELGASYNEVSAKTGFGIEELFIQIAEEVAKKFGVTEKKQTTMDIAQNEDPTTKKPCGC